MSMQVSQTPHVSLAPVFSACCFLAVVVVVGPAVPTGLWRGSQTEMAFGEKKDSDPKKSLGGWKLTSETEESLTQRHQDIVMASRVNSTGSETRCENCFVEIGRFFAKFEPHGLERGTTFEDLPPPPIKLDGSCDPASLRSTMGYSNKAARWTVNHFGKPKTKQDDSVWCDKRGFPGVEEAGDRDHMFRRYRGKTLYFIGDSLIRNHMVLTAARMCNSAWLDRCWAKMPSPFWDYWDNFNGPLGCVPKNNSQYIPPRRFKSKTTKDEDDSNREDLPNTACYNAPASFRIQAIPGLTLAYWPKGKKERTKMLKGGHKYPAMIYEIPVLPHNAREFPESKLKFYNSSKLNKVTFVLLFIKYPHSEFKSWLKHWKTVSRLLPKPDAIFTTMGAWLKGNALGHFHRTYPMMLETLASLVGKEVPIVAVELTPNLDTAPPWSTFVEAVLRGTHYALERINVSYVPVRYLHDHRQYLQGNLGENGLFDDDLALEAASRVESVRLNENTSVVDLERDKAFRCGYYDPAHAGLRCHFAANTLMLAAMWPKLGELD